MPTQHTPDEYMTPSSSAKSSIKQSNSVCGKVIQQFLVYIKLDSMESILLVGQFVKNLHQTYIRFKATFFLIPKIGKNVLIHKKKFKNVSEKHKTYQLLSLLRDTLGYLGSIIYNPFEQQWCHLSFWQLSPLFKSLQGLFAFSFFKIISSLLSIDRRTLEALRFFPCASVMI